MRKIIISFCILLSALSLQAQSVSGIRIDGGNTPILVYFGGNQMCLPTTTCFVANLDRGYYTVEVYATRFTRPGERVWKGERLYNERVYFDGRGVKDIFVDDRHANVRPGRPGQGEHRAHLAETSGRLRRSGSRRRQRKLYDCSRACACVREPPEKCTCCTRNHSSVCCKTLYLVRRKA